MTKKKYIEFILNDLKGTWESAESFLILVKRIDEKNDKLINYFYKIFKENIEIINDEKIFNKINESKKRLKFSLLNEKYDLKKDEVDIINMEKELDFLY